MPQKRLRKLPRILSGNLPWFRCEIRHLESTVQSEMSNQLNHNTIIRNFLISFHMYADDSQLYKSVSPNIEEDQLTAAIQLQNCTSEISDWMNRNKLKINEDKTNHYTS